MAKTWHIVSYDVHDEKRLRKVARILEGYGWRIQYSLFCCRLSEREKERMRYEVKKVLCDEDDLLIISICDSCVKRLRSSHGCKTWPEDPPSYAVIVSKSS